VVEFSVLGPVEAVIDGQAVPLAAEKPRALLAILLLSRNRVVAVSELIEELWGENPPDTATTALQVYVSQLRKALGSDRVLRKPPGYSIRVEEGELDLDRFEELVREGREQLETGDAKGAAERLKQALALWRGPALAEFGAEPFARDAGGRLEDARVAAIEARIEADLALGRHADLLSELEALISRHPYRERLRGQLMLAQYRSGRQAEALELYRRTRETLVEELGIEPSLALQELERAILQHDPSLEVGRAPPRLDGWPIEEPQPRRRRLLVPVLVLALAAAAAAAVAGALALTGGGSSVHRGGEVRPFVAKVENFLVLSREGRRAVSEAIDAAAACKLTPRQAAERLNRVQLNRQSLLQQIAALSIPNQEGALRASDLLQKAAQASITADWHYRDWLLGRKRCGRPKANPDLHAAWAADAIATQAKQAFLAAFNPLARRFKQRLWTAREF